MRQALCQSGHLDGEYLFATFVQRGSLGDKRMRVIRTGQVQLTAVDQFCRYPDGNLGSHPPAAGGKRRVHPPLRTQEFHVDLAHHQLLFQRKAFTGRQQRAVLVYQAVAGKHHVGGRLAEPARTEHIACQAAGRLLAQQRTQVGMLAYRLVVGREVEDNLSSLQGQ